MTATVRFDKWENTASTKSVTMDQIAGGSGLVPIVPSSINVPSGTATVSASGKISFTAITGLTMNGIFSSLYSNYLIQFMSTTSVTAAAITARLRAGTTDASAGQYFDAGNFGRVTGGSGVWYDDGATSWVIGSTQPQATSFKMDIFGPNIANSTSAHWQASANNTSAFSGIHATGLHVNSSQFDGMTLAIASGNVSGYARVFGYRD